MSRALYRHGDVLIQATTPPSMNSLRPAGHLVLAEGELTGHMHRIAEPTAATLYAAPDRDQYLHVTADRATLVHEEHAAIALPSGWYRVWQQREYTPERIRPVAD